MDEVANPSEVATALRAAVGLLVRRLRQAHGEGELSLSESSALGRLYRDGPMTAAALARAERISPQSMGATLSALQSQDLVSRLADPDDGRRIIVSVSEAGRRLGERRRGAKTEQLARALEVKLTPAELEQLAVAIPLLGRVAEGL